MVQSCLYFVPRSVNGEKKRNFSLRILRSLQFLSVVDGRDTLITSHKRQTAIKAENANRINLFPDFLLASLLNSRSKI